MKRIVAGLAIMFVAATASAVVPTAPTSLTVTALNYTNSSVTLQWVPGTGNQVSTVIFQDATPVVTTTGNVAVVNNLTLNLPYSFYAVTKDILNNFSASSNTVTATLSKQIQFIGGQNVLLYGNVTGTAITKPVAINPDGTLILSVGNLTLTAATQITSTVSVVGSITNTVSVVGSITNTVSTLSYVSNTVAIQGPVSVTNTVTVATHAVTQSGTWNSGILTGANTIGNVGITNTVNVVCLSGCSGGGSGGAVSVTNPATSAVQIAGSITNTVTVGTHAVTQSGSWNAGLLSGTNIIGAVGITNTVDVNITGGSLTVTASSGPITVSNTATNAVQIAGSITNTVSVATHPVTQAGTWNVGILSGSNTVGNVGVTNTVNVNVLGGVITVTAAVDGVTVTNTATSAVQIAGSITNTVDVSITNASVPVAQAGTWNLGLLAGANTIGNVGVTSTVNTLSYVSNTVNISLTNTVNVVGSVTNTVNANITNTVNVNVVAGSITVGGVAITNSATNAVQVAGSITNTVNVNVVGAPITLTVNIGAATVTNTALNAVQIAGSITNSVAVFPEGAYFGVSVQSGVDLSSVTITSMPPITFPSGYLGVSVVTGVAGISVTASQGSPWTVSGSVDVTTFPSSFIGVSVVTGVAGISVTASQGSPFTVSGSVSVTNLDSVTITSMPPITFPSGYLGVSVVTGVAGISVTASQGSPWTVSGSVGVTSFPSAYLGVSIVSSVSPTNVSITGIAGGVTLPVGIFYGGTQAPVVALAQSSPFTSATAGLIVGAAIYGRNNGTTYVSPRLFGVGAGAISTSTDGLVTNSALYGSDGSNSFPISVLYDGQGNTTIATTSRIEGGVTVTNTASAAVQIAGSITNTVNVAQASPWTVSGSVGVTSFPSSFIGVTVTSWADGYLGVSVVTGVAGISVTASQGSPWTVSGSVGVTSFPSSFIGVTVAAWNDGFLGVSVQTGVAGISVTASQGSPWTVSGSVSVTNNQGLSVTATISDGVTVTNTATNAVQIAGSITNTVNVAFGGGVTVTNTATNAVQIAGSITNTVNVAFGGGVSVTNPATAAVQIAGSITNTVTITGALTANQSVNVAQMNGVATTMGNGVAGTGVQRVAIASDNTAFAVNATLQTGSNTIGALTANQSVNVAQINGVAPSMGSGVNGTGVQRVTLATDQAYTGVTIVSSTSLAIIAAGVTSTGALASNIEGNIASGVATAGNPLGMGGRAATTVPTGVADGQRVEAQFTKAGKLVVMNQTVPEMVTRTTTTISASTAETTVLALLASTFWDIDSISVINTDGTNNTRIDFRSATGGPVVFSMGAAKSFGGFVQSFPVPMPQDAVGTNWTAQCSVSTTDIRINIVAHQRK